MKTPSLTSLGQFKFPEFDDVRRRAPILDYTYGLVYYEHRTLSGKRENATMHLEAAMEHPQPIYAAWRLRIWMHLEKEEWIKAANLCGRLVDHVCVSPGVHRETVEENVYFAACTVGFVQALLSEREAICFKQVNARVREALKDVDSSVRLRYDAQRIYVARLVRGLAPPSERGVKLGEIRRSVLIENCGLAMNSVDLQEDLRHALSRSATPDHGSLSALDRR